LLLNRKWNQAFDYVLTTLSATLRSVARITGAFVTNSIIVSPDPPGEFEVAIVELRGI
jgi:hypothetical protein